MEGNSRALRNRSRPEHRGGTPASQQTMMAVINWPRWLFAAGAAAEGGQGDERSIVMTEESLQATPQAQVPVFRAWCSGAENGQGLHVHRPCQRRVGKDKPVVLWRNATFRVRGKDRAAGEAKPLRSMLDEATVQRLGVWQEALMAVRSTTKDFATTGSVSFEVAMPEGAFAGELQVDAELVTAASGDTVLRCVLSDTEDVSKGRPSWALLGDPKSPGFKTWKATCWSSPKCCL